MKPLTHPEDKPNEVLWYVYSLVKNMKPMPIRQVSSKGLELKLKIFAAMPTEDSTLYFYNFTPLKTRI